MMDRKERKEFEKTEHLTEMVIACQLTFARLIEESKKQTKEEKENPASEGILIDKAKEYFKLNAPDSSEEPSIADINSGAEKYIRTRRNDDGLTTDEAYAEILTVLPIVLHINGTLADLKKTKPENFENILNHARRIIKESADKNEIPFSGDKGAWKK